MSLRITWYWKSLLIFRLLPKGFSNRDLRTQFAPLLGKRPDQVTPGQMTYLLRRLRLRGFIPILRFKKRSEQAIRKR